jgi:hypothetical protein
LKRSQENGSVETQIKIKKNEIDLIVKEFEVEQFTEFCYYFLNACLLL